MPALDPDDLATLAAELADPRYDGLDDLERFEAFHAPTVVPNPEPRPVVPKPFSLSGLRGLLQPGTAAKIRSLPTGADLVQKINAGNRAGVLEWLAVLRDEAEGLPAVITLAEAQAVHAELTATIPDPDWPESVPGPSRKDALFPGRRWALPGGGSVDYVPLDDFAEAR